MAAGIEDPTLRAASAALLLMEAKRRCVRPCATAAVVQLNVGDAAE